jgi:hypothetical protein
MTIRAFTPDQDLEVADLYRYGFSIKDVATLYGVTTVPVRASLKRTGTESRRTGRPKWKSFSEEEVGRMVTMWNQGMSASLVARAFETTRPIVVRILDAEGEKVEPRGDYRRGDQHPAWKGGRTVTEGGYVRVYVSADDPMRTMADSTGYVLEHRLVMARALGRALEPRETVHHKNDIRDDNRLENLQLRQGNHGKGAVIMCLDCGSHNVGAGDL